ncbi:MULTISPECIES: hypothetical protein [unclassified Streptomyces]|uniref:hypothetical protein n=1 Tax=unclassified Streptomyces TaxID=2593676 RepID=UPI000A6F9A58|nr:hypothetical protein [Streptomyces sp. NRRL F-2747]
MSAHFLDDAFRLDPRAESTAGGQSGTHGLQGRDLTVPDWMTTGCADPVPQPSAGRPPMPGD